MEPGMPFFRPGGDAPFREEGDTWQGLNGVGQVPTTSPPLFGKNKPHRADPCNAKQSSNMQQLSLQFEGYADSRQPVDAGTAKQCKRGAFYEAFQHFLEGLRKSVTWLSRKISIASFKRKISDSELCQVLGITPWHFSLQGLAYTAALFLVLLVVCGVAEWLEGGAV